MKDRPPPQSTPTSLPKQNVYKSFRISDGKVFLVQWQNMHSVFYVFRSTGRSKKIVLFTIDFLLLVEKTIAS